MFQWPFFKYLWQNGQKASFGGVTKIRSLTSVWDLSQSPTIGEGASKRALALYTSDF
jgi:hypothetical protein